MNTRTAPAHPVGERPTWKRVVIPSEHGGWGLTGEPILLGLLLAFSWAGVAIGAAAMLAFLARTPLKLALVDRRRDRELERSALARRIGSAELIAILALGAVALGGAGWRWLVPVAVALRCSQSSSGSTCAVVAAVSCPSCVAPSGWVRSPRRSSSPAMATCGWRPPRVILAARSVGAIPFIRTQILRLHRGSSSTRSSDRFQFVALVVAAVAAVVDPDVFVGSVAVLVIVGLHLSWVRRSPVPPAKVLGLRQMALGIGLVAATAIGVGLS